jgi:hypothetical protein
MRVAIVLGALLFTFVSGLNEFGLFDTVTEPENQMVQSFDDHFPPPPSYP